MDAFDEVLARNRRYVRRCAQLAALRTGHAHRGRPVSLDSTVRNATDLAWRVMMNEYRRDERRFGGRRA